MAVKKGLGRGFDSLVPQDTNIGIVSAPKTEKVYQIDITSVQPKAGQPRQYFNEQQLDQLALSIKEQGVLQPIIVVELEHNKYSIIAGERRWRASQMAGLQTVPAIIKEVNELQHIEMSLLENVQRADLNPIETALTIQRMHTEYQQSYESIAKRLGKAYTTIINMVRLLQLPNEMQTALVANAISEGHARALLSLAKYPAAQEDLFEQITQRHLSVRQAEAFAIRIKKGGTTTEEPHSAASEKTTNTVALTLQEKLGVPVTVSRSKKKGKITLAYSSQQQYDSLLRYLQKL